MFLNVFSSALLFTCQNYLYLYLYLYFWVPKILFVLIVKLWKFLLLLCKLNVIKITSANNDGIESLTKREIEVYFYIYCMNFAWTLHELCMNFELFTFSNRLYFILLQVSCEPNTVVVKQSNHYLCCGQKTGQV